MARRLRREGNQDALGDAMAAARRVAAEFPRLAARLDTEAAEYAASPADTFEFGLEALLDGVESQLGIRPSARRTTSSRRRNAGSAVLPGVSTPG